MMGASRTGERERGKSDEIDAQAVARAVVKDGVDRFPAAYLDERAMEIRLLVRPPRGSGQGAHPDENRLRWHLLELCPELEAKLKRGALSGCERWSASTGGYGGSRRACGCGSRARSSPTSARSPARPSELEHELLELIRAYRHGCSTSRAAAR